MPQQTVVKLYVSNIPYSWRKERLMEFFAQLGKVTEGRVILDRDTDESRGFGFVSVDVHPHGPDHWRTMQGVEVEGDHGELRTLTIDIAKPKGDQRGG